MSNGNGKLKRWIKYVELSTKPISLTPLLIGVAFNLYVYGTINLPLTAILFLAVFLWDVTVTMINNFVDKRREGGVPHFSTGVSLGLIIGTGGVAMLLGLWLTWLCGLPVLVVGVICFSIGILYSLGPISISRTPYGEIASGLTEGFFILFLTVYINAQTYPIQYADLRIDGHTLIATLNWVNIIILALLALPNIVCTANIMLANNICDVERDSKNERYTLPYYIGRSKALRLFRALYAVAYLGILLVVIVGVLHPISLTALLSAPIIFNNVKVFAANPVKSETFILSVKNYMILLFGYLFTILAGWILTVIL